MGNVKQETMSGVKWGLIQRLTMQPVQFVFGIILARLISPAEMGILGLTAIFFAVANILKDAGFGSALIRKQDRTETDCSTVFWFNVGMSLMLALGLAAAAPWFAVFFNEPALINVTRISAVMMFLNSTVGVHFALYSAKRDFKTPAIIGMVATLVSMPITVWLAFVGWSYWAMLMQGVMAGLITLVLVWIVSPWKPRFLFSLCSFREFFAYGSKLAASGIVYALYSESRTFVIGKFYSAEQLALYSKAARTCNMPIQLFMGLISNVTFPILSTLQKDTERLIQIYRTYVRLVSLVCIWPLMAIVVNADTLIYCLYGEKWISVTPYIRIICLGTLLDPIAHVSVQLFMVVGRTDLSLRRELWLRSFGITAMIIGAFHSVMGICVALVITSAFNMLLSALYMRRCIQIRLSQQLRDMLPYIAMALLSVLPCLMINMLPWSDFILLPLSFTISFLSFCCCLFITRDAPAANILQTLKSKLCH